MKGSMGLNKQFVIKGLGYAGLLPFLLAMYLLLSGNLLQASDAVTVFLSYSTVILAFLGGTLWGRVLALQESPFTGLLLVASNLIALFAWANLLLGVVSEQAAVAGLAIGFVLVLLVECWFARFLFAGINPDNRDSYLNLRITLTSIVVLLHLLMFYLIS